MAESTWSMVQHMKAQAHLYAVALQGEGERHARRRSDRDAEQS